MGSDRKTEEGTIFISLPPGMDYVYFDEETVIQINTEGPWGLNYLKPEDDPRKTQ